jgi:hypothetical protein
MAHGFELDDRPARDVLLLQVSRTSASNNRRSSAEIERSLLRNSRDCEKGKEKNNSRFHGF